MVPEGLGPFRIFFSVKTPADLWSDSEREKQKLSSWKIVWNHGFIVNSNIPLTKSLSCTLHNNRMWKNKRDKRLYSSLLLPGNRHGMWCHRLLPTHCFTDHVTYSPLKKSRDLWCNECMLEYAHHTSIIHLFSAKDHCLNGKAVLFGFNNTHISASVTYITTKIHTFLWSIVVAILRVVTSSV